MSTLINPRVNYAQKEFVEILNAFNNNESLEMIIDSYENYTGVMFDYIKTKNELWFDLYFAVIDNMMQKDITRKELKDELMSIKGSNKSIIKHITSMIYDNSIITEDLIDDLN